MAIEPIDEVSAYPEKLREREGALLGRDLRIGVALSGGGIRSATLSLGFFQGLATKGVLKNIDVLSTVSGGGYFGGFFGHLVQRTALKKNGGTEAAVVNPAICDEVLENQHSPAVSFLRENGRYLSPNGAGDLFLTAAGMLRNWVAVLLVIGSVPLLAFTLLALARFAAERWAASGSWGSLPWIDWVSPIVLVVMVGVAGLVACSWAYWLVPDSELGDSPIRVIAKWLAPVVGIVSGVTVFARGVTQQASLWQAGLMVFGVLSVGASIWHGVSWFNARRMVQEARRDFSASPAAPTLVSVLRSRLTRGLAITLQLTVLLAGLAAIDSIGQAIVKLSGMELSAVYAAVVVLVSLFRDRILSIATQLRGNERPALPLSILLGAAAVVLLGLFLGGIASIPHFVARAGHSIPNSLPAVPPDGAMVRLEILLGITMVLTLATNQLFEFANRSSMHAMYEARLRRAYLGASNEARTGENDDRPPVTEPHPQDGLSWEAYQPHRYGGPIHLINVTVNETVSARSQVEQRDRKGLGMAVGPGGISVGIGHHALWDDSGEAPWRHRVSDFFGMGGKKKPAPETQPSSSPQSTAKPTYDKFRIFPAACDPEALNVGEWVAISGGAVSTGTGARTNLALSILVGFFNVRLGYWWDSGVDPGKRKGATGVSFLNRMLGTVRQGLSVQFALLDEWLARFPGVARRQWNLSDGGHFENMGGYELIRRRLPLIIVCDNEQDAAYGFSGLANLVRKARIDFGAEIDFELDEDLSVVDGHAALDVLRRGKRTVDTSDPEKRVHCDDDPTRYSLRHAALARITYAPIAKGAAAETGFLLYVKPTLTGNEPVDVRQYHVEHPLFPHEPTSDQFFDEAQWESYRRLGEHMAIELCKDEALELSIPQLIERVRDSFSRGAAMSTALRSGPRVIQKA